MKSNVINKMVLAGAFCALALAMPACAQDMSPTNVVVITPGDFAWDAALINLKEIRLGEAAQKNSQNPDVQKFGEHMIRDHSKMNARLEKIAASEGLQLPDTNTFYMPVSAPEQKPATALMNETPQEKLVAAQLDVQHLVSLTGPDFDRAYADAMVNGHAKVIEKFQGDSSALQDGQLKKYADRGLRTVRDHYQMALKLQAGVNAGSAGSPATNSAPNM